MSTTTRRRSITKTHERISQLGWEPDYFQPADKYPSRYKFPDKAKDPMKHIMREYLPMELEKDERVYGVPYLADNSMFWFNTELCDRADGDGRLVLRENASW